MEYEQWKKVLSTVNADSNLSENNVIKEIKRKLKEEDKGEYEKWEKADFDVSHQFKDGSTLLHWAIEMRNKEVAELLIKKGANVNAVGRYGDTPLFPAATYGNTDIIEALLDKGANVNAAKKHGAIPLLRAAICGNVDAVNVLLKRGAQINAVGRYGNTLLTRVIRYNNVGVVKALLDGGVQVNVADKGGMTPLHLAVQYGYIDMVKVLIENGADPLLENKDGKTPVDLVIESYKNCPNIGEFLLSWAKEKNLTDIVNALTKKRANFKTECGDLHLYVQHGYTDEVKALIKEGADVDAVDRGGNTPLHLAAGRGDIDIVKALLNKKAQVNAVGGYGCTPLYLAARDGYIDIIKALLNKGAEVNAADRNGYTPLHQAAVKGHIDIVKTLIEKGAKVDAVDESGATPLCCAAICDRQDATEILIQKTLIQDFSVQKPGYLTGASSTYWDKCKNKIEGKIGNSNTSYLDLLKADEDEIATYMINDEIKKTINEFNYKGEFSILESQIRNKFNKGVERRELIDNGGIVITRYSRPHNDHNKELPLEVSEKVASYLSNADLKNLVASYLPNVD